MNAVGPQPRLVGALWVCLSIPLLALVGFLDFVTGWEMSFSIFYLAPIALAAWAGGRLPGILAAGFGACVWLGVDLATPHYSAATIPFWNAGVRLGFFLTVAVLVSVVRADKVNLERDVRDRTEELRQAMKDLQAEVENRLAAEERRRQAEMEVLLASEREQRRIGLDLHDSIQGNLVGVKMTLQALRQEVRGETSEFDEQFVKISRVITETIRQTRGLASSLCPVDLEGDGLCVALAQLAETTTSLFGVTCEFHGGEGLHIAQERLASHLYYISREAVSNALKHAQAQRITLAIEEAPDGLVLSVHDDGIGFAQEGAPSGGMGLRTMHSRAEILGGRLDVRSAPGLGTEIVCTVPRESLGG